MDYDRATRAEQFKARACDAAGEMYATPNYGANAVDNSRAHGVMRNNTIAARPTVGSVADLSDELHTRLSMLEESLRTVHQRLGAEHGPEHGAEAPVSDSGPVDFAYSQIADAIRRIDNFRTIVETINARI